MSANRPFSFAVILGTNEIASAVAVRLHRDGFRVALSHDALPPVIRRKMAFHDALYDEAVSVDGITATRAGSGLEVRSALREAPGVVITELGLLDLIVMQKIDVLVDSRMQKYLPTPDLRRLAGRYLFYLLECGNGVGGVTGGKVHLRQTEQLVGVGGGFLYAELPDSLGATVLLGIHVDRE